jgi:hypothetical protein
MICRQETALKGFIDAKPSAGYRALDPNPAEC